MTQVIFLCFISMSYSDPSEKTGLDVYLLYKLVNLELSPIFHMISGWPQPPQRARTSAPSTTFRGFTPTPGAWYLTAALLGKRTKFLGMKNSDITRKIPPWKWVSNRGHSMTPTQTMHYCKGESSNWNNHKKLVVWSSRYMFVMFVCFLFRRWKNQLPVTGRRMCCVLCFISVYTRFKVHGVGFPPKVGVIRPFKKATAWDFWYVASFLISENIPPIDVNFSMFVFIKKSASLKSLERVRKVHNSPSTPKDRHTLVAVI